MVRTERGFTLFEVLVAFAIASLALGVLFSAASDGLRGTDVAAHDQEAMARARSHLAALAAPGRLIASDRQGDDGGGYRWREHIAVLGTLPPGAPVGTAALHAGVTLYAVVVAISWSGREIRFESERLGPPMAGQGR